MTSLSKRYTCELCSYYTDKTSSYEKHMFTWKHIRNQDKLKENQKNRFMCIKCKKKFKNEIWYNRHTEKCVVKQCSQSKTENIDTIVEVTRCSQETNNDDKQPISDEFMSSGMSNELLMTMMKYVRESEKKHGEHMEMMQKQLEEERNQCKMLMNTVQDMIPKIGNFNNNKISINIFLQEHCKDALNLKDFVDSLRIELSDVSKFQDRSMIDAVGNVFVNGLRQLDLYKRPIHCMDLSRETLYIKDNDAWENDTADKSMLSSAITAVAAKQSKVLQEWERIHPNWSKSDELTAEYLRLVRATTCPIERGSSSENRIIHNIAKEVVVDLRKVPPT